MKITKAQFDETPVWMQSSFKPVEGNADQYDNGEDEVGGLKSALEKEKLEKIKAAQERDVFKDVATKAENERKAFEIKKAADSGDFSKLEQSYKDQLAIAQAEATSARDAMSKAMSEAHSENVISSLLGEFTSVIAGRAILSKMTRTEIVDGKAMTRFLDINGNPTAFDVEEFKKNLLATPDLKGILVASKGAGGGSTANHTGGGSTVRSKQDFKTATEESQFAIANPDAYSALPDK